MKRYPAATLTTLLYGLSLGLSLNVHAFENEGFGYEFSLHTDSTEKSGVTRVEDGRNLVKFELGLKILGIPLEPEPTVIKQFPSARETSAQSFMDTLRFVDPDGAIQRYLSKSTTRFELFRDYFSGLLPAKYLDFGIDVKPNGPSEDSSDLMGTLARISEQVKESNSENPPLAGVRIIIDPGHMGTEEWEDYDGKWVSIYNGKGKKQLMGHIREGELTLWTAFLTANALKDLGADVKITRNKMGPVSNVPYLDHNYTATRNQYFYDSFDGWMRSERLLTLGDAAFKKKLLASPSVSRMFPKFETGADGVLTARGLKDKQAFMANMYLKGEDLEARVNAIDDFHPHLTIDIHYDAVQNEYYLVNNKLYYLDNKGRYVAASDENKVEGFVPGSFGMNESGSRLSRAYGMYHALNSRKWNESVNLTSTIATSVSKSLDLSLLNSAEMVINGQTVAVNVKDGVYARNLQVTRRSTQGLVAYLECLHYDTLSEFFELIKKDGEATYTDQYTRETLTFTYPTRIEKVAQGISTGVLEYFQNLGSNPGELKLDTEQLDSVKIENSNNI
ncbi:MAG: hypothetical protein JST80_09815 [Bdellovibrionales bacterium]|nr:hypothetical protein [Bdellovibrionales bacterium]